MSQPLPNALEVERTLLGTFLIDNASLVEAKASLPVSAFYGSHHREIYSAMVAMSDLNRVVDVITLTDTLNTRGSLEKIGGAEYIAELCENIASRASVPDYIRILSEKYVLRNVIETCNKISSGCYEDTAQIQKILSQIEHMQAKVSEDCDKAGVTRKKTGIIVTAESVKKDVFEYHRKGIKNAGVEPAKRWPKFSKHHRAAKKILNIWTGIPSHGKSEMIDDYMVNLALDHGWKWGIHSPENYPYSRYIKKLSEKILGKSFFGEIQTSELDTVISFINDHFYFLSANEDNDDCLDVETLLRLNVEAVNRFGVDGITWDPWNEIDEIMRTNENETNYIKRMLTKIRWNCRRNDYQMNIVAHPTKLLPDPKTKRYPVPRLYDINGGANWYNKADNGFTVYRNFDTKIIDLHIQKVKFKEHGEIGVVQFKYDLRSGRFIELDDTDSFTQDSTPVKMDLK